MMVAIKNIRWPIRKVVLFYTEMNFCCFLVYMTCCYISISLFSHPLQSHQNNVQKCQDVYGLAMIHISLNAIIFCQSAHQSSLCHYSWATCAVKLYQKLVQKALLRYYHKILHKSSFLSSTDNSLFLSLTVTQNDCNKHMHRDLCTLCTWFDNTSIPISSENCTSCTLSCAL